MRSPLVRKAELEIEDEACRTEMRALQERMRAIGFRQNVVRREYRETLEAIAAETRAEGAP